MKKGLLFLALVLFAALLPAMALAGMDAEVYRNGQKLEDLEYVMPGDVLSVQVTNAGDTEFRYKWFFTNEQTGTGSVRSTEDTYTVTEEDAGIGCRLSVEVRISANNRPVGPAYIFPVAKHDAQKYNINLVYNKESGYIVTKRTWAYENTLFWASAVPIVGWEFDAWTSDAEMVKEDTEFDTAVFLMPSHDVTLEADFKWWFDFELQDDRGNVIPLDGTGQILCDRTYIPIFQMNPPYTELVWDFYPNDSSALHTFPECNNGPLEFATEKYRECIEVFKADGSERLEPMRLRMNVYDYLGPANDYVYHAYADFIIPKPETVPQYAVSMDGVKGKKYLKGETVHLTAEKKPGYIAFEGWEGLDDLTLTSGSADSQSISFTMPARPVNLITVWKMAPGSDAGNGSPAPTPSAPKPPRTGDASAPALWLALAALSLAGAWVLLRKKPHIG